jgi:hypothetical protein
MSDTNTPNIPDELKGELKDLQRRFWDLAHFQLVEFLCGIGDLKDKHLRYYCRELDNIVTQLELLGLEFMEIIEGRDPCMPSFRKPESGTE